MAMQSMKTKEIIGLTDAQQERLEAKIQATGADFEAVALPFEELWGERAKPYPQHYGKIVAVLRIPHRLFISECNIVRREREKARIAQRRAQKKGRR